MKKLLFFGFILLVILYFYQLFRLAKNYSQSYRFGDEDAHMVGGYFLLKGYKMYQDFSGNHQPLTYIFPAIVQKITSPNTLYAFIARQRMAIFIYSILWNLIYLLTFGKFVFLFTAIFEICRYVLLGNKVLGEPLAMYPLAFLFGLVIKQVIFNKQLSKNQLLFFSISTFLATFSLLPIWPSILILNFLLFAASRDKKKNLIWQLLPMAFLTFVLFIFVPFKEFYRDTVFDNITYVIPKLNKISEAWDYFKIVFLPFTAFHSQPNFIEILTIGFSLLYGAIFYFAWKKKKLLAWLFIILALILSNNRTVELKYGNFHVLPWLAAYFFVPIVFFSFYKSFKAFIFLIFLAFWVNFFGRTDYYGLLMWNLKNDLAAEHNVNYSDSVKYGLGIAAIKKPGERLLALPNDALAIWVAKTDLATRPIESYDWQYELPRYRNELFQVFRKNPPEFYLNHSVNPLRGDLPIHEFILKNLKEKYVRINHLGKPSDLYMLKSKITDVSYSQWKNFENLLFEKPK